MHLFHFLNFESYEESIQPNARIGKKEIHTDLLNSLVNEQNNLTVPLPIVTPQNMLNNVQR